MILDEVPVIGTMEEIEKSPPPVVLEFFSYSQMGSHDFLGRMIVYPTFNHLTGGVIDLKWMPIGHPTGVEAGELLCAFEMIEIVADKELPVLPAKRGRHYQVPSGIRPSLERTAVEILCWGVRNMRRYQFVSVNSPSVSFELGGTKKETQVIRDLSIQPNFNKPVIQFDMALPTKPEFTPALNIQVLDNRRFGRKPVVGTCSILNIQKFNRNEIERRWFGEPQQMLAFFRGNSFSSCQSTLTKGTDIFGSGVDKMKLLDGDQSKKNSILALPQVNHFEIRPHFKFNYYFFRNQR